MARHPQVPHPRDLTPPRRAGRASGWVTRHLTAALGSVAGMYLALVVPLVAFGVPPLLKILGLISSYWVQLWALFVLQRTSNEAGTSRSAKADADHLALTHIAHASDETLALLRSLTGKGGTPA